MTLLAPDLAQATVTERLQHAGAFTTTPRTPPIASHQPRHLIGNPMSAFSLRIRVVLLSLAILGSIVSATLVSTAPAHAEPNYPGYSHAVANFPFATPHSNTGGYVDCPSGQLALASGSAVSDIFGALRSGNTTTAGTGSFASAQSPSGVLEVRSHCVAARVLRGTTRASLTIRDSRPAHWGYYVRQATCPEGTVAYGGGANMTTTGTYDIDGLYTYGTKPDGRSWTYAGAGQLGSRALLIESKCLPRARLGRIITVKESASGQGHPNRPTLVAAPRCPADFVAVAGGAWWHSTENNAPTWAGYLTANQMSSNDAGWVAVGKSFGGAVILTAKVTCTDRLR